MSTDRGIIEVSMLQWDDEASQQELRREIAKQGRKVIEVHSMRGRPVYIVVTTEDDAQPDSVRDQ